MARPSAVLVSAATGEGLASLGLALETRLCLSPRKVRLRFKAPDARGIAAVYSSGRVMGHQATGDDVVLDAEIPERLIERYREHLV